MKRGKRFFENENLFIYGGVAVFIILAISIGIIMYMTNKNDNSGERISEQQPVNQNTESASTDMGKTVEEQEQNKTKEENNTISNTTTNQNTKKENTTKNDITRNSNNTTSNSNVVENTVANTTNAQTNQTSQNTVTETNTSESKKEITFIKPAEGEIICEFAKENLIYSETLKEWITHTAIDIKVDKTSVIKSSASGIVKSIVNDPRYGLTVIIEHEDGYETVYSNLLTAEFVVEGEEVEQGQTIGTAGNTASFESSMESHLHFELLKDGEYLDPSIYLK